MAISGTQDHEMGEESEKEEDPVVEFAHEPDAETEPEGGNLSLDAGGYYGSQSARWPCQVGVWSMAVTFFAQAVSHQMALPKWAIYVGCTADRLSEAEPCCGFTPIGLHGSNSRGRRTHR